MKAKHHLFIAAALCACIALAACTDDANEPATGGRTPLVFTAAVHGMPATTRSNTAANQWTDGDVVAVEMNDVVKKYIVKAAAAGATATLSPADEDNTHFWPGLSQPVKVRAWRYGGVFPLSDNFSDWDVKPAAWTVSASQYLTTDGETDYQRSDFLYAPAKSVSYDAAAGTGLTFYHQTARVVVKIRKAGLVNDGNKESMDVWLGDGGTDGTMLMQGTFDASRINPAAGQYSGLTADGTKEKGSLTAKPMPADAATHGYARCYEALVIPQNMDGERFICIVIPGTGTYYYKPAPGEANLRGGYTYTYDITVSEYGTLHVTVGTPIAQWVDGGDTGSGTVYEVIDLANPQTISDNGAYLMTGQSTGSSKTLTITGGSPLVILKDLNFRGCIHITGGTPVIKVEGTNNRISAYYNKTPAIWLEGDNANVHVTGGGVTESRLELESLEIHAAIGTQGTLGKADFRCGNISISNLTLSATVEYSGIGIIVGGAAIGTGGGNGNRKCGDITITDASVIAKSSIDAAAIGFGSAGWFTDMTDITYEMGNITITNSTIESTIVPINGTPAHIGSGAKMAENYNIGDIRINTDKSGTEFFEKFNGGKKSNNEVIVGFPGVAKRWNVLWRTDAYTAIDWSNMPGLP